MNALFNPHGVQITNGSSRSNEGYRQVALTPLGVLRDVSHAIRRGRMVKHATVQIAREGDIVVGCQWYPEIWYIKEIRNQRAVIVRTGHTFEELNTAVTRHIPPAVHDFLQIRDYGPSLLPDGCGWTSGITAGDVRKEANIRALFAGHDSTWVEHLVALGVKSTFMGLPMAWSKAAPMPDGLDVQSEYHIEANIDRRTMWFGWRADGTAEILSLAPTEFKCIDAAGKITEHTIPLHPVPDTWVRCIKVLLGAYTKNETSVGVRWELYAQE